MMALSAACVLRGAGEKSFSPGNDIAEFQTERANKQQAIDYGRVMHATAKALNDCLHPLVAQIHGICVGEWRSDPRYASNSARMQNLQALTAMMEAVLLEHDQAYWLQAFDAAGVPVGPVHFSQTPWRINADNNQAWAWTVCKSRQVSNTGKPMTPV